MDNELIAKAKKAGSASELLALAKESGTELSEQQAQEVFERLHKSGELADEELDSVAGGGCHKKDGRLIVTISYQCMNFKCKICGEQSTGQYMLNFGHGCKINGHYINNQCTCSNCAYMSYEGGLWLCNHPNNRS